VQEKNTWVTMRSSISKEVNSLMEKIYDEVQAKYAHQQKMAKIQTLCFQFTNFFFNDMFISSRLGVSLLLMEMVPHH
jgi:hypothetical protein